MRKVAVFAFLIRDKDNGRFVIAPCRATQEAIELIGGKLLPSSAESVDESQLDDNGYVQTR
jgi:hypothetical protein